MTQSKGAGAFADPDVAADKQPCRSACRDDHDHGQKSARAIFADCHVDLNSTMPEESHGYCLPGHSLPGGKYSQIGGAV